MRFLMLIIILIMPSSSYADCCNKTYYSASATAYLSTGYPTYTLHDLNNTYTTITDCQTAINNAIILFAGSTTNYSAFQYITIPSSNCVNGGTLRAYYKVNSITKHVFFAGYAIDVCSDTRYAILGSAFCPDGQLVAFEYCECSKPPEQPDAFANYQPTCEMGEGQTCGNSELYDAMWRGEEIDGISGYIFETYAGSCVSTADDISNLCVLAASGSGCGTTEDEDSDGVPDAQDRCPGTPAGTLVNDFGCPQEGQDQDGDGVEDSEDFCPDTPPGVDVNVYGCTEAESKDTDGDGVPDHKDTCPDTAPGESVDPKGCSQADKDEEQQGVDPDDGIDNDDDTGLLSEISQWLAKISGQLDKTVDPDGVGGQVASGSGAAADIKKALEQTYTSAPSIDNSLNDYATEKSGYLSELEHENVVDDVPEEWRVKTVLLDVIKEAIDNNPITDPFTGVAVNASGNCSFQVDLFGRSITFSICEWAEQINIMGTINLWLATIHSLLILFRRR